MLAIPDDLSGRLVALVEGQGGTVMGSTRKFGMALGVSHTAVATALSDLETAGRVAIESGKRGTVVRLVA
jgi:DNA-binding transcriptional regulator YhcF (GntR family)